MCFWLTESVQAQCVVNASMQVDLTVAFYLGFPHKRREACGLEDGVGLVFVYDEGEIPGCNASPNILLTDRLQLDKIVR